MQETEAKFYVLDLKRVEARLQELGAVLLQERLLETNIRFDLPSKPLLSEGRVLRLRHDTAARLTYKSASDNDQGVLSRTEIEFVVDDFSKAKQFLEALGYGSIFVYEKYRTTYLFDSTSVAVAPWRHLLANVQQQAARLQRCHIMLDELPYGDFVEIEGESVDTIRGLADQLGLRWDAAIATSYHALFDRVCSKRPELDPTQLTFAALNGQRIVLEELSVQAADAQ